MAEISNADQLDEELYSFKFVIRFSRKN